MTHFKKYLFNQQVKVDILKILVLFLLLTNAYSGEFLFTPIPGVINDVIPARVTLGKKLFNDPILSGDNTISCASCHDLDKYGVDGLAVSVGIGGQKGRRNTPTIFNVRYNFVQTWDGKNKTLAEQARYAIEDENEMAEKIANVVHKLTQNDYYKKTFKQIYAAGLTETSLVDALEQYMKTLVTPYSRFDQFLRGDKEILSEEEIAGYKLFQSKGCIACHNGINIGSNLYQKLGIFDDSKVRQMGDYGRYLVTGREQDKYYFKVPSLRNIEKTAPYLHNGAIDSLPRVVRIMAEYQLGQQISDTDINKIVAFLRSLSGKIPPETEAVQ